MKKIFLLMLLLIARLCLMAQKLYVQSFFLDENDLTAIMAGTTIFDGNEKKCALIKIETTIDNLSFSVGTNSVGQVLKTENKVAEIWVYLQEGVRKLTISHLYYGSLNNYDLGQNLKSGKTYVLQLGLDKSSSLKSNTYGSASITSIPSNADVFINGFRVGKTPLVISQLHVGNHSLHLCCSGFAEYRDSFVIEEGKMAQLSVSLSSLLTPSTNLKSEIRRIFNIGDIFFTMIRVDGGVFQMGEYKDYETKDDTVHQVSLSTFYIGETEVTQGLWEAVMGNNPSTSVGLQKPVDNVTWEDCQVFLLKLNNMTGADFRLPTEAEWEFAARGGNRSHHYKYSGSNNLQEVAWSNVSFTHNVKTKKPNELGLYDMSGNVFEWCHDWYGVYPSGELYNPQGPQNGDYHIMRGGSVNYTREYNIQYRPIIETRIFQELNINNNIGIRLAL